MRLNIGMPGLEGQVWLDEGRGRIPGSSAAVFIKKRTLVIDIAEAVELTRNQQDNLKSQEAKAGTGFDPQVDCQDVPAISNSPIAAPHCYSKVARTKFPKHS